MKSRLSFVAATMLFASSALLPTMTAVADETFDAAKKSK